MREYAGVSGENQERFCGLRIDRVPLPFDVHTRMGRRKAGDLGEQVCATAVRYGFFRAPSSSSREWINSESM
jgi:hypothetical protein